MLLIVGLKELDELVPNFDFWLLNELLDSILQKVNDRLAVINFILSTDMLHEFFDLFMGFQNHPLMKIILYQDLLI